MATKYKVMLLGDSSVGKTCAICTFCDEPNSAPTLTICVDIRKKQLNLDGEIVNLEIWDTAGQERFNSVSLLSYRNIKGILLMYDVTRISSFNTLKKMIKVIEENISEDVVKILVGNKCDASDDQREIHFDTGLQYANELNIPFFEISAKENINVHEPFYALARKLQRQVVIDKLSEKIKLLEKEVEEHKKSEIRPSSKCACYIN